jgi:hypothetical protein
MSVKHVKMEDSTNEGGGDAHIIDLTEQNASILEIAYAAQRERDIALLDAARLHKELHIALAMLEEEKRRNDRLIDDMAIDMCAREVFARKVDEKDPRVMSRVAEMQLTKLFETREETLAFLRDNVTDEMDYQTALRLVQENKYTRVDKIILSIAMSAKRSDLMNFLRK